MTNSITYTAVITLLKAEVTAAEAAVAAEVAATHTRGLAEMTAARPAVAAEMTAAQTAAAAEVTAARLAVAFDPTDLRAACDARGRAEARLQARRLLKDQITATRRAIRKYADRHPEAWQQQTLLLAEVTARTAVIDAAYLTGAAPAEEFPVHPDRDTEPFPDGELSPWSNIYTSCAARRP